MTDWRDKIKVGDILRTGGGKERVVRQVSSKNGRLYMVIFTILHCSWTERCYTCLTRHDLKYGGYKHTGHRYRFRSAFDVKINRCIARSSKSISCCEVT
jgi:hypothetical protein